VAKRVSISDLTLGQIAAIEDDIGLGVNEWPTAPKKARLYALVYAAATGCSMDEALGMRLGDIDLSGDDEPDPTTASA
jgi:integrase